jgi:hypothetical protein
MNPRRERASAIATRESKQPQSTPPAEDSRRWFAGTPPWRGDGPSCFPERKANPFYAGFGLNWAAPGTWRTGAESRLTMLPPCCWPKWKPFSSSYPTGAVAVAKRPMIKPAKTNPIAIITTVMLHAKASRVPGKNQCFLRFTRFLLVHFQATGSENGQ